MTDQDNTQPQVNKHAGQPIETREAIAGSGFIKKGAKLGKLPPIDQGLSALMQPTTPDPGPQAAAQAKTNQGSGQPSTPSSGSNN